MCSMLLFSYRAYENMTQVQAIDTAIQTVTYSLQFRNKLACVIQDNKQHCKDKGKKEKRS